MAVEKPPSGRQFELASGAHRAVVVEVGGGLRECVLDGHAVLDGYAVDSMADGGRGQPLIPWPNRIRDGAYEFEGQQLQLPIEEIARHNAIHGLTRWVSWNLLDRAADRVLLGLTIHPRPGYPFTLDVALEYALDANGLTVHTTATNIGTRALPFGLGQHPYFTVGTPLVDHVTLQFGARTYLEWDEQRRVPTGKHLPVGGSAFDFARPRPIGSLVLDECFAHLERDIDGRARVVLTDPGTGRAIVMWMDAHFGYLQIFSGDTLPAARRRRGLALEPMSCPPDAFRSGTDLLVLQPDARADFEWGISALRV